MMIDKKEICSLIPHDGTMCLLDSVDEWNEKQIVCQTMSHRAPDNPLRNEYQLPVTALIEYGAQAMAIHGGLLAREKDEQMQEGYLAALRDVSFLNCDVSTLDKPLEVIATQAMASGGNMIYQFTVKVADTELISGRATVVAVFKD